MEAVNLSKVSQTNFTNKQEIQKEIPKAPEQKKNGKKLLAAGAAAVATIAIAALAIKKGKLPKATQVADLKFNKGIAMKGDELFTGVAEHANKEGDKFLLEYKDGALQRSMKNINPKTGAGSLEKSNFIKHYSEVNGTRKVSISKDTIDGVQRRNCEISKNSVVRTDASGKVKVSKFENGKIRVQNLPDGTTRRWHENGQMSKEFLPGGTERQWYENGQMSKEFLPGGTVRQWFDNGQIVSECKDIMLEDYTEPVKFKITYDKSGQIETLKNETRNRLIVRRYDEGYSCVTDGYDNESLKEIFDKLGIEMPDIKFD